MELTVAREFFTKFLKEGKYRITPERFYVLDEALNTDSHFDADSLYLKLRNGKKEISRATVYKTLDLLLQSGLISKHQFDDGHSHYERAFGKPHHHHLICSVCKNIIEFTDLKLTKIQNEVCHKNNFEPHSSTFQIFGICENCQREIAESKRKGND